MSTRALAGAQRGLGAGARDRCPRTSAPRSNPRRCETLSSRRWRVSSTTSRACSTPAQTSPTPTSSARPRCASRATRTRSRSRACCSTAAPTCTKSIGSAMRSSISTCSSATSRSRASIDRGADLHQVAGNGETALHCASAAGQVEAARLLIGRGADVDRMRHGGGTAPAHAASSGSAPIGSATPRAAARARRRPAPRRPHERALALARTRRAAGLAPDGSAADLVYQASLGPWSPATHAERPAARARAPRAILRVGYRIASRRRARSDPRRVARRVPARRHERARAVRRARAMRAVTEIAPTSSPHRAPRGGRHHRAGAPPSGRRARRGVGRGGRRRRRGGRAAGRGRRRLDGHVAAHVVGRRVGRDDARAVVRARLAEVDALRLAAGPLGQRVVHVREVVVLGAHELVEAVVRVRLALVEEVAPRQQVVGAVARARALLARGHRRDALVDAAPVAHEVRVGRDVDERVVVAPRLLEVRLLLVVLEPLELEEAVGDAVQRPEHGVVRRGAREHLARVADAAQISSTGAHAHVAHGRACHVGDRVQQSTKSAFHVSPARELAVERGESTCSRTSRAAASRRRREHAQSDAHARASARAVAGAAHEALAPEELGREQRRTARPPRARPTAAMPVKSQWPPSHDVHLARAARR